MKDYGFLKVYYRTRVNDLAQKKRGSGERCRDKDFVFPALRQLEQIAKGGEDAFFENDYVVSLGMTRGDYDSYSFGVMMATAACLYDDDLLGSLAG